MAIPTHLTLELVTPERAIAREDVDEVQLPGAKGYFGVLPGHTPMLAELGVGELWYRRGQEKTYVSVAFGVAEVLPDRVIVMCRDAERADEIDIARAEAAAQRAKASLARPAGGIDEIERARVSIIKAMNRLKVAEAGRRRR
jgi:F-type H+-transporting ATPase subunit epsilon